MKPKKIEIAKKLANAHRRFEPNLRHAFVLEPLNETDPQDPIKLLEVVEGTIERGIEPIAFAPDPARGIVYPSWVIEISPAEFRSIRNRRVRLRDRNWNIGADLLTA